MARRRAWILNLDADLELGEGARYTPTERVLEAMRPHVARLRATLLDEGDVLLDGVDDPKGARGLPGRAFCPTPRAIARLIRAGATPEPHPSAEILARVNSRAFASSLGATLPGGEFCRNPAHAEGKLAQPPPLGHAWRVKRAFSMAGRGQRVIDPSAITEHDRAFVRRSTAQGGVQVEPDVAILDEFGLHGLLAADGTYELGALVRQRCDGHGAWLSSERVVDLAALGDVPDRLLDEGRRVAQALARAGYFGPFGVDAYTYRDGDGAIRLQPRSEINARYSMGFAVGAATLLRRSPS